MNKKDGNFMVLKGVEVAVEEKQWAYTQRRKGMKTKPRGFKQALREKGYVYMG